MGPLSGPSKRLALWVICDTLNSMKGNFYGSLLSFLAILIASFVFLLGLAYWNGVKITEDGGVEEETTCITSSGESC